MSNQGFNATTLTFGGATVGSTLRSITFTDDTGEVDVTSSGDGTHVSVGGARKLNLNAQLVGGTTLTVGDSGTISIAWNDGNTETAGSTVFRVASREVAGSLDGEILSNVVFMPYSTN